MGTRNCRVGGELRVACCVLRVPVELLASIQDSKPVHALRCHAIRNRSRSQSCRNFGHLIIAVRDLEAAMADYRALGFTVYYGGKHTHKATHNGLIALADGSYLELLAPQNPDEIDRTIDTLAYGEGFGGYALLTADIDGDVARLRTALNAATAASHRDRYDGVRIGGDPPMWAAAPVVF
ncbi:MAG: VOC family protein [Caldilineaceae bacterium]